LSGVRPTDKKQVRPGFWYPAKLEAQHGHDRRGQSAADDAPDFSAVVHTGVHLRWNLRLTLSQNEFLYALIFLTKSSVRTVPVGVIAELIRGDVFYWGQLMAGALLGSIPVAIIYSFFVEHYVAGLTSGSVKG
jgi:hypothetical protein